MTNRREFASPTMLKELIDRVAEPVVEIIGNAEMVIAAVAPLGEGGPGSLEFCKATGRRAAQTIAASTASVLVVRSDAELPGDTSRTFLRVDEPGRWFVRAMTVLFPPAAPSIHPSAIVEPGAEIGAGTRIGAGTFVAGCVVIGRNCIIGANCTIGEPGLAIERDDSGAPVPYPHVGKVVVGDNVRVGANSAIVRGILEDTVVGPNCQIGNMVNVGHNCRLEADCWISTGTIFCGSVQVGRGARIGAGVSVNNRVRIGAGASVGLGSVVTRAVRDGDTVFGVPARPLRTMKGL